MNLFRFFFLQDLVSTITTDFGASRVDRFAGPGSMYTKPTSMQNGPLATVDLNRSQVAEQPVKRATRATARQASMRA